MNGKSFLAALIQFRHSGIRDRQAGVETLTHGKSCGSGFCFCHLVNVYISGGGFKAFFFFNFFVPILGEVIQFDY